mgnify:CR=1 FL=1
MRNIVHIRPAADGAWQATDMLEQCILAHGTSKEEVSMAVDHIAVKRGNTEVMVFGDDGHLVEVREHGVIHAHSTWVRQAGDGGERRPGIEDI